MNNLNPLYVLKEYLDMENIPYSVRNNATIIDKLQNDVVNNHARGLRDLERGVEDAKSAAAIANSNAEWTRQTAINDTIRERNYNNHKIKGITSVGGGLAGGYLGKKLGDKIGKVDRIKEFKDMVLRSDTITDLEQKVKKSGFDKVYPQALEYIQKNRGNPKWKTSLSNSLMLKRVLFPSISGAAGTVLGSVAGYYGGDYLNNNPCTFDF